MSNHTKRPPVRRAAAAAAGLLASATASAALMGPTPYLSAADSPFAGVSFSYFHLENFEDHLLNTPGVTGSAGGVTSVVFGPSIHDSVDADDGALDGSGLAGDDWFSSSGASGVTFTFNAAALGGALPTHAGIVWTDGGFNSSVTFTAFDHNGAVLGTMTVGGFADGSNNGETAEDRFFGAVNPLGISAIFVSNPGGGIEVDHLQYGLAAPVPEPGSVALLGAGLGVLGMLARRRQRA
jgi:hypothetical protein